MGKDLATAMALSGAEVGCGAVAVAVAGAVIVARGSGNCLEVTWEVVGMGVDATEDLSGFGCGAPCLVVVVVGDNRVSVGGVGGGTTLEGGDSGVSPVSAGVFGPPQADTANARVKAKSIRFNKGSRYVEPSA